MIEGLMILKPKEISRKINRLAWEIYERNSDEKEIILVGVSGRGEFLAIQLSKVIQKISNIKIKIGVIDLDKDNPCQSLINISLDQKYYVNKVVILVDDVLNSGKTLMYAARHFLCASILSLSVAVLVERKHSRFPVRADYIGLSLATTLQEYITVVLDGQHQGVYLS